MMTEVQIDPAVFNEVYTPHLHSMARTQIFYGGSGSGKSVFLAQRCVFDVMRGGRNFLVTRQVGRTIRGSVFTEISRVISEWGLTALFTVNKSDMLITCRNGYQILFAGLDDVEKLKSLVPAKGALTDIWIEEATEADRDTVKQLYKRQRGGSGKVPKRLVMSFNPIMQTHWIYEDYFKPISIADDQTVYSSDELLIVKTWYIHNRFLTESDVQDLTNESDGYYYQVYTLGNWGILGNVIFQNWRVEDLSNMHDQFTERKNGLDFGFASDPAAVHRSHYDRTRKIIYIFDELYEKGLTNDILALRTKEIVGDDWIVGDSAEPKSIAEMQMHGVNITGAKKGKDSVLHGIQWLQQQEIIIDPRCINHRNEFMQFHWKEGAPKPTPVGINDHLISAMRYAYEDEALGGVVVVPNPFYD